MPQVHSFPTITELSHEAATLLVEAAWEAVTDRGRFLVAFSGGNTPRPLYELLASEQWAHRIPWQQTHVFWADERCVPPEHAASNYRLVRETLLTRVQVPPTQVHRIRGEQEPQRAAREYEARLQRVLGPHASLDLVLLGMGADGHTASLFPGTAALRERRRWVVANHVPALGAWRITLTYPAINSARQVVFMVAGPDKADMLARALADPPWPVSQVPAAGVRPVSGRLTWLVDEAAALPASMGGPRVTH